MGTRIGRIFADFFLYDAFFNRRGAKDADFFPQSRKGAKILPAPHFFFTTADTKSHKESHSVTHSLGRSITPSPYHPITLLSSYLPILLLTFLPIKLSSNCTPNRIGFRGYSFLNPFIIDQNIPSAPLFINIESIYEAFGGQAVVQEKDNLTEWQERYCKKATIEEIRELVYEVEYDGLSLLHDDIKYESKMLSSYFQDNTFARYLKRSNCLETVEYLLFARRCEPHVTLGDDPWKVPPRDLVAMQNLLDEGLATFQRTESHYIRLRYAYQIIRLAHYQKNYAAVLSLYDMLMPQVDNDPSIIEDWINGHRAGALFSLGRNVEASYQFSKIFENCPSKAESAFRSFDIRTDEEWEACVKMCQSDKERATLYVLRAQAANSKKLEAMQAVYNYDTKNRHLEILLVEEMRKLEKDLLGLGFNDNRAQNRRLGYPRAKAGDYIVELQEFVARVVDERKVKRPVFWQVVLGYIETLAGNYYDATRTFEQVEPLVEEPILREQLRVFQLALRISAYAKATEEVELEVNDIRKSAMYRKYRDFNDFLRDKMAFLYGQGDSPGKAFLSAYRFRDLKVNPQLAIIDDLLAITRKPNRSGLETALVTKSGGETIEKDLINLKATLLFSEFRLEEALTVFKEINREEWDNYGVFNPFVERFRDCVRCVLPDTANNYNKGDLMERLINLETLTRTDPDNAAMYHYEMGTAFYNMTYFSFSWQLMDHFRSGTSLAPVLLRNSQNGVVRHPNFPAGNREHFDCSRALFHFERARELAKNSELAARAAYAAAKCERNAWYVNRVRGATNQYEYFGILQNTYSNTDFYKRVVRECKTFQAYLRR